MRPSECTIQLLIEEAGNRAAVRELLDGRYDVDVDQSVDEADCYLVDDHTFPAYHTELREHVEASDPVFCPIILVRRPDSAVRISLPDAGDRESPVLIDDIVDAPIDPDLLFRRINTLLVRRNQSRDLLHYITRLEESNRSLEQFAYAASHDLQEPLRMVSSYLQLIEQRHGDEFDADAEDFLEFAVDGADRMRSMIDGLLEYSRVDTSGESLERVDLNDVLDEVRSNLQVKIHEHDAGISVESLPRVRGDPNQLVQLFQNLLSNAIEYSGDDPPRIRVSAERATSGASSGDPRDAASRGAAMWNVAVDDDGIGIDADGQERIFDVFQRLHSHDEHDGTGIGLALCKRIVERHNGDIRVDSEPGAGATFTVTLPAIEESDA
ncbi:sensor histidine kinase [Halosolutus gelatinilyticus]|uniref:sensor histidine kinase n=1 Tax=Halosolutus gelatinilyticus TaxID=2931975 RepID=UPI001FF2D527|nr:ATP-binding protein [Halosolutus gelatinilyticus]